MSSQQTPTTKAAGKAKATAGSSVAVPLTMSIRNKTTGTTSKAAASDGQVAWKGPKPESTGDEPFGQGASKNAVKPLKAGAADFKPANGTVTASSSSSKPAPIVFLNEGSTPDDGNSRPVIVDSSAALRPANKLKGKAAVMGPAGNATVRSTVVVGPVGTGNRQISPDAGVFFTSDVGPNVNLKYPGGHYVKIERIDRNEFESGMAALFSQFNWQKKVLGQRVPNGNQSDRFMTVLLCFDDLRDAAEAPNDVSIVRPKWQVSHISQAEYAASTTASGTQERTDPFDGQVVFSCEWQGDLKEISTDGLRAAIQENVKDCGEIVYFAEMRKPNTKAIEYRAEFYRISDAHMVLEIVNDVQPIDHNDWHVVAQPYAVLSQYTPPDTPQRHTGVPGEVYQSPTGRTAWQVDEAGNVLPTQAANRVPRYGATPDGERYTAPRERFQSAPNPQSPQTWEGAAGAPRNNSWAPGDYYPADTEPQCVSIGRIENGQDVRTTIMLRNIPNRWTCHDLREVLNATSFGQYDFSYLRIDFNWNTNVGYAFVNFTDPMSIIPFVKQYVGRDWNGGSSRRTAQVSYATVQGYDCLVEKFRNSAIMDEYQDFTPKLWYTEETANSALQIGAEKPFPPPNNTSKKQRSHDNAGTIGLFAPGRNGARGGADRTRRSNWDRGTPRQIEEDAAFNAQYPVDGNWGAPNVGYYSGGPGPVGAPFQQPFFPQYNYNQQIVAPHFVDSSSSGYGPMYYPPPMAFQPPFQQAGYMHAVNPASQLRTISQGRLAGRPKNVTVGNTTGMYANVPRTFNNEQPQASGSGGYSFQQQYDQGQQYEQYEQGQQY